MPPKKPVFSRMEQSMIDDVVRIAQHKGVSTSQVMRWAVDEFIGAHAVELSNVLRPTTNAHGGVVELSNAHTATTRQTDKDLADQWSQEYDRRA